MDLPGCLERYRTTWIFTERTMPGGLAKAHRTKAGVWGRIVVLEGRLAYRVTDRAEVTLDADTPGVVEPEVPHSLRPLGKVRFYLEFHRQRPNGGDQRLARC